MLVDIKLLRFTDDESDKHWGAFVYDGELFSVWKKASQQTFRLSKISLNRDFAESIFHKKYNEKESKGYVLESVVKLDIDFTEDMAKLSLPDGSSGQMNNQRASLSWMIKFPRTFVRDDNLIKKSFSESSKILGHECFDDILYDDGSYSISGTKAESIDLNTISYQNYEGSGIILPSSSSWRPILSLLKFRKEIHNANPSDTPCLFFSDERGNEVNIEFNRDSIKDLINLYGWDDNEVIDFSEKLELIPVIVKFAKLDFPEYDLF